MQKDSLRFTPLDWLVGYYCLLQRKELSYRKSESKWVTYYNGCPFNPHYPKDVEIELSLS